MKKIIIHLDDGTSITKIDNDDEELSKYCQKLSSIFEETNVVILNTTNSATIIRPTRINGIEVFEIEDSHETINKEVKNRIHEKLKPPQKKEPKKRTTKATPAKSIIKEAIKETPSIIKPNPEEDKVTDGK